LGQDGYFKFNSRPCILVNITDRISDIGTPAGRLEHSLHLPIALIIIPLFAATPKIPSTFPTTSPAIIPIDMGCIMVSAMRSKSMAIPAFASANKGIVAWAAVKLKIAVLPQGSSMSQIFGVSFLGGIGFTMSICG
jgi:NhaA family Na+:H+ antiporter